MKGFCIRGLIVAAVSFSSLVFGSTAQAEDGVATPIVAGIGQTVQLDPTDGFSAEYNLVLRPVWSWVSRPATSVADISDPTALRPTFTVDADGTYIAQLDLFGPNDPDGTQLIHRVLVEVGTGNLTPVARGVIRNTPEAQTSLTLDATPSYDVDGNALTYSWTVDSAPVDANVIFTDATAPLSGLQFDKDGTYVIALTVQDENGATSAPSLLQFSYNVGSSNGGDDDDDDDGHDDDDGEHGDGHDHHGNGHGHGHERHGNGHGYGHDGDDDHQCANMSQRRGHHDDDDDDHHGDGHDDDDDDGNCTGNAGLQVPPVANLVFDQVRGTIGAQLTLDAHNSTDVDGDILVADYSIAIAPTSSASVTLQDQDGFATITPDLSGDYLVSVAVSDGMDTGYDQQLVVTGPDANIRPVARIASVPAPQSGTTYALNGSQSFDFDGDLLTYRWSILSKPAASAITLAGSVGPYAEITPDVPGTYIVQLIADDGTAASVPATMLMVVDAPLPVANAGADIVLPQDQSVATLDATLSTGTTPTYAWSISGLTTGGENASLDDVTLAMPELAMQMRTGALRDVVANDIVYRLKGNQTPDQCKYDLRQPDDMPWADPNESLKIKLKAKGRIVVNGVDLFVWEVHNKRLATRDVRLETESGVVIATYTLPGKSSLYFTTPDLGGDKLEAWVGSQRVARKRAKNSNFGKDNPVCIGAGSTVAQLIVSDPNGIALPDTVFVTPGNVRPVLTPTARITTQNGNTVSLAAVDYAFDANSDVLTHSWSVLYRPQGSTASVDSDPAILIATGDTLDFAPDRSGLYLIQVTAADGVLMARPAVVEIEVVNAPPVAVATGPAQVFVGETATLDGSGSYDPDGDALSYQWTITSQPAGSTASIPDPFGPMASFVPDVRGEYAFSLVVSDYEFTSAAAVVTLTVPNRDPVAALTGEMDVSVGQEVTLSALGSTDPDGDALTYSFAITQSPAGATPTLTDLATGEAGFIADVAGTYLIQVTVSDGLAQSVATLEITARAANAAPILGNINTLYTVELGLELALDLTATDPDGDPVSFFATPLPLPTGITLDAATGQVRFRPEAGQEGSYSFTVGVSDGTLTDTAVLNIEVVPGTASDTSVYGRVLDAVDFANGVETPLAGMPVRLKDAALVATTDANGAFSFGSLTAGPDQIFVEPGATGGPGGYIGTTRAIRITANQDRDLAPDFLLTPLNDGCATVVAGQDTVLNGASSGVTVKIMADTVQTAAGDPYTGDVCLGSLPELFNQSGFPEDTQACRIYALDAPGAVFTQGIAITAPNVDQLPEQTRLNLWRQSASNGLFRASANAGVDAGGTTVSSTAASFRDGTLFTFLPQAPKVVASADQPTGNRQLSVFEGDLSETYTLPGYRAFNRSQQVGLAYHSTAANPDVIVAGDVSIAADSSLPATMSTRLDVGGLSISDTADWTPRQGLDGSTPALVGEAVTMRQSMLVDATGLTSGRYGYTFIAKAKFACSTVSSSHNAELYVQNETDSPYGTGWSVDNLQKLVVDPDGRVAIIDDDGISTFDPKPSFTEFDGDPLVFPTIGTQNVDVGDYNGDGLLDISFAETGTGNIGFITNYGDRDLQLDTPVHVAATSNVPQTGGYAPNLLRVATGELTNDGALDVAYALQLQKGYGFAENDGFGKFSNNSLTPFGSRSAPRDVTVTDLDNDGYDDIIIAVFHDPVGSSNDADEIWVDYGGPNGRELVRIANVAFGKTPLQISTGDVDGNGYIDIAYRTKSGLDFIFNNGNRNYTVSVQRLGSNPVNALNDLFQLFDANGDGKLDFVWSGYGKLQVFLNLSGQTFDAPIELARPPSMINLGAVSVADTNGDGIGDIILSKDDVAVYFGRGDGTFEPFETGFVPYSVSTIAIADIDGDGSLDLISSQRFSVTVHFSKPSTNGQFVSGNGEFSTLTKLPDGSWQRRYKDGSIVEFNAAGLQTAEVDPQGNRRTFAYDAGNRLTTITDQVGGVTQFTYDASNRLASITYPDGRETLFTYDDEKLAQVTEPDGGTVGFAYDSNNRLISTTNQNGNTSQYSYDATGKMNGATLPDGSSIKNQVAASLGLVDGLGGPPQNPRIFVAPEDRVTTVTDRKGETTEIVVNQFGATVKITDPLGRVTLIERDENNLATRIERPGAVAGATRVDTIEYDYSANVSRKTEAVGTPLERSTSYEYEANHNKVTRMVDADGFETTYTYDNTGNALTVTDPEGGVRQFSYTPEGKLATRTDKNGNVTAFAYDADQNLSQTTYADGSVTQMSYDTAGNATLIAEATGTPFERQVQRTYDTRNRVLTVETTAADGAQIDGITSYTYDHVGNLKTVTDETGLVTTMTYDALERLTAVDDPAEGLIQRSYNTAGEVIQHINGDGEIHSYAYDNVSRLTQTTDPEGYVKSFAYDLRDNIATVTDGRGGITGFGYDALDRMTARTNPLGQTMTRAYDTRDNLISLTREDGTTETATYDGLSRRTQVVTPDNTLTYTFDPRGNLTAANDNDSGVSFTYDARNRLASTTTDGTKGPQPAVTLTYSYDALDRRVSVADSLGGSTTYAYDVEDRLATLTAPWGTAYSFGYDGDGRRTSLTSTSGRVSTMGYTNGLLSALSHVQSGVTLTDLAYEYGVDGQLTAIVDNLDPAKSKTISYDALNRLVQVAEGIPAPAGVPVPVEDYAYDGEGNRTASHLSTLYSSNDHNQLLEDDSYTYAYDSKGNRISRTAKSGGAVETYSYDSQNRLVGYSSPTTSATYAYDALDRRIAKTVDGTVTAFVYDPWGLDSTASDVLLDFEAGALTKRWLHGPQVDEPLGFEAYSGTTAGGTGTAHEVFADRLGSVIEVVEAATGTVVSRQRFDSFGLRTATGPLLQRYGFTGREHDAESGLIYFRARAYDPAVGMFLQRDPIGFSSGDLNLYAYTWDDPYNWKDPSGLAVATDFSMFTAFTVGLAGTSCLILEPCKDGLDDAGKAVVGGTARGIGGLFAAIGRLINRMNDALFSQGNDGSGSGGSGDGEDESNGGERSGPKTGNPGLDGLLEGSSKGDRGPKGWETPGTRGKFEERLKGLPGAEQNPTDNGGNSTTFPDGTKIDTYPGRVSTGRPGWSVTKPGGKPGKPKGSFLE